MKIISYIKSGIPSLGIIKDDISRVIDIPDLSNNSLPDNLKDFLEDFETNNNKLNELLLTSSCSYIEIKYSDILPPINNPSSFRDFYAFRKHVEAGRKSRNLEMIPEYDEIPVFYFSNHQTIIGPGTVVVQNQHLEKLDFELEIGLLISKPGKNIKSSEAFKHVAGLMILNDWSARSLQFQEMKLNLGPAKGKDFATSIGPYLVTLNELRDRIVGPESNMVYDLNIEGYLNDKLLCEDNLKNISWSFSEMIERASYGVELQIGDLIGSGTCSTGCLLELNLTNGTDIWLKEGDTVNFVVDRLGNLSNTVSI
mgnify:CR=1 FL=1